MDKVAFINVIDGSGQEVEHAVIDHGNGEYTSMPKSVYDKQLAQNEAAPK